MSEPTLEAALDALERGGFAALVWDREFRVVGVTAETLRIMGMGMELPNLPLGQHIYSAAWVSLMATSQGGPTLDSQRKAFRQAAPAMLAESGDVERLREVVDPRLHDLLDGITPAPAPPVSSMRVEVNFGDRTTPLDVIWALLHSEEGRWVGGMTITKPGVGGAVLAMLATGDAALFERMLRLLQPARRSCAMLFADLDSSTLLARRLSTHAYFALVRRLTFRADRSVVDRGGIIGKHVGDGITAFFLAESAESESAAARACIESARALREDAALAAERSQIDPSEVVLRMGLHWSASAYIGRLLTSGRTEVTALGDEINEGARIEACATGGRILASKGLIERLEPDDARALRLDPIHMDYAPLAGLPHVPDKARRDAPALSVAEL